MWVDRVSMPTLKRFKRIEPSGLGFGAARWPGNYNVLAKGIELLADREHNQCTMMKRNAQFFAHPGGVRYSGPSSSSSHLRHHPHFHPL
jgi:hypothetical protein